MKPVVLIGGGGHARSIVECCADSASFAGYTDRELSDMPGLEWLGTDQQFFETYSPNDVDVHLAVGFGSGYSLEVRRKIIKEYEAFGHATLVASSAWLSPSSAIGVGSTVMARAVINRSRIGRWTVINTGAIIEHDCNIGDNCFIGPGAILCGGAVLADDVFIGAGAVLRQGVSIASGVVIGMGAIVINDIDRPGTYVGSPAKRMD